MTSNGERGAFFIPSTALLVVGVLTGLFASVSLGLFPALDIVRSELATIANRTEQVAEIRLGVWSACSSDVSGARTCSATSATGYEFDVVLLNKDGAVAAVRQAWTRGLVLTPISTAIAAIALIFRLIPSKLFFKITRWVNYFATLMTIAAWAADIALLVNVQQQFGEGTYPGAGFWLTYTTLVCLISAAIAMWMGKRRPNWDQGELNGAHVGPSPSSKDFDRWNTSSVTLVGAQPPGQKEKKPESPALVVPPERSAWGWRESLRAIPMFGLPSNPKDSRAGTPMPPSRAGTPPDGQLYPDRPGYVPAPERGQQGGYRGEREIYAEEEEVFRGDGGYYGQGHGGQYDDRRNDGGYAGVGGYHQPQPHHAQQQEQLSYLQQDPYYQQQQDQGGYDRDEYGNYRPESIYPQTPAMPAPVRHR